MDWESRSWLQQTVAGCIARGGCKMRNDGSARGLLGRGAVTRVDATVNSLAGCSPCRANARKTHSRSISYLCYLRTARPDEGIFIPTRLAKYGECSRRTCLLGDSSWGALILEVGKSPTATRWQAESCPFCSGRRCSSSLRRQAVAGPPTVRFSRRAPTW